MQAMGLANGTDRSTDWQSVEWRKANRRVRNLRQRIFKAAQAKDWNKVRSLQKLMLRSYSNTLISVRRVTQENKGKRTPGIDGVKVTTPEGRGRLVDLLMTFQPWKAKPTKRVYIPKANGKLRPLGIPTIVDRCLQARVKNALEPRWEAVFEATSYGFRPGRSCQDAIRHVSDLTRAGNKVWVVDADIKGAFDNIAHDYLVETIGEVPGRELIKQWLKAGYVEMGTYHPTDAGTPQGGVISPLLANIALHGMEEALGITYDRHGRMQTDTHGRCAHAMVRYADDFVVLCESKAGAEQAIETLTGWLAERGLSLSEEKTRIVHLADGFDFLGFNVRQYRDIRRRTGTIRLIKPSKEALQRHRDKMHEEWSKLKGQSIETVIRTLAPKIKGWANYYRHQVATDAFRLLDNWIFQRECKWVNSTHPNKSTEWKRSRYWGRFNKSRKAKWVFGDKRTGAHLPLYTWTKIERHVKVKGTASPDDPSLREYWKKRTKVDTKGLSPSSSKVARNQNHVCPICGESLFNGEELQMDHVQPKRDGGEDSYDNLKLLHEDCHKQKTARDWSKWKPTRKWLRKWLV
jgi:RNA-directed DNA polymerase